jgi:hypothetical protein
MGEGSFAKKTLGDLGNKRLLLYGSSHQEQSKAKNAVHVMRYFPECLPLVFGRLDGATLGVCMLVSKAWRQCVAGLLDNQQSIVRDQYHEVQRLEFFRQRELFGQLLVHRLKPLHAIYNRMRIMGMLAHELRAVSATSDGNIPVFDRTRSRVCSWIWSRKSPLNAQFLFSEYGMQWS